MYHKSGIIVEVKTTPRIPRQAYPNHLRQVKSCMAIAMALGYKIRYAKLLYLVIGSSADPEYLVTVTEEEKNEILEKLIGDAAELQYAIDSRDTSLVEGVFNDKNYENYRVLTGYVLVVLISSNVLILKGVAWGLVLLNSAESSESVIQSKIGVAQRCSRGDIPSATVALARSLG
jgi:hypothetical protein